MDLILKWSIWSILVILITMLTLLISSVIYRIYILTDTQMSRVGLSIKTTAVFGVAPVPIVWLSERKLSL